MQQHNEAKGHMGRDVVRYLLVFTDGDDNCSSTGVQALAQAVQRHSLRNFHMRIITVNLSRPDNDRWRQICRPACCELFEAATLSAAAIQEQFDAVLTHMRSLVLRDNRTREVQQVTIQASRQNAAAMDAQVASMMETLHISGAPGRVVRNLLSTTAAGGFAVGGSSVTAVCDFGFKCTRISCMGHHPTGRMMDIPCRNNPGCSNAKCGYKH